MEQNREEIRWLVRPLREEDFDDIVAISEHIWGGHDYLPKIFRQWIKEPGLFMGLENLKNHHIVAAGKYSYLSDGTGWLEGLRVHSDYQNMGLSKILSRVLFEKALHDLQSRKIHRIANCTHLSNEVSIHLSFKNGFAIQQRYLVVEAEKNDWKGKLNVQPWQPTFETIKNQPYFQQTKGYICQSFLVQAINASWFDNLAKRVTFAVVNGCPGWVDPIAEPYIQLLDPTPETVVAWLQYGTQVLQQSECITFLYPEPKLIEALKSLPVQTWMDYKPDCLYLVYQPTGKAE